MKILIAPAMDVGNYWVNQADILFNMRFDMVVTPNNIYKVPRALGNISFHMFGDRYRFLASCSEEFLRNWDLFLYDIYNLCQIYQYPLYQDTFKGM
jgi:hypothetical protein